MINKNVLAFTIGDPSGIGSEIIAKSLSQMENKDFIPVIFGNEKVMQDGIRIAKTDFVINKITDIKNVVDKPNVLNVFEVFEDFDISKLEYGKVQKQSGLLAGRSIEKAIEYALKNEVSAIVTAPLNKEAFKLAGFPYPGHTEMFAALTKTKEYSMILAHGNLRVAHVTTHVSMRQAIELIKKDRILKTIKVAHNACVDLGIKTPKIAVAGLNAHAGENGLFGDEEIKEIIPAIEQANKEHIQALGPIPADSLFSKAVSGMYDCVVAMYHDQGHIPIKLLGFSLDSKNGVWTNMNGVNITFGLPIIRVSVDHGTAFGKAGKGTANPGSLINSIQIALLLAKNKKERNNEH